MDEHRIAEGEEAVSLPHGFLISPQDILPPRKSGNQHDERRLRQVEIGDQRVQDLKLERGYINERFL